MPRRAARTQPKAERKRSPARPSRASGGTGSGDLKQRFADSLEREKATSAILGVISSSRTDAQPVFDAVVRSAARLCRASTAALFLSDGRTLYHPANHGGSPEALAAARSRYPRPLDMDTVPGMTVLTRSVVHVPDTEDASVNELIRRVGRELGFRSIVSVPMLREGEAFGAVLVTRREAGRFSDADVALLLTFADQAVIAIENVRLFTELQDKNQALTEAHSRVSETLEQQTATADILRVISSSPTDTRPVFDAIVQSASRLCGGEYAIVTRYDGELLQLAALHNPRPGTVDETSRLYPQRPRRDTGLTARAFVEGKTIHAPDIEDEDLAPSVREGYRRIRLRAVLSVPMIQDGRAIGVIGVSRETPGAFSDRQIALLGTFADQAVIAVENVRLFNELQEKNRALTDALEQQTATGEVLRAISRSAMDAQPVFQTIAESATRLSGGLFGSVYRFDGELIHMVAHHNYPPAALEFSRRFFPAPPNRQSFTGRAILARAAVHVPDVSQDTERLEARGLAVEIGFRSALAVPMLRDGLPIGAITVWHSEVGPFSEQHIGLLQTFAEQAVIAIQNEDLFRQLQARTAELTRSVEQLTALGEVGRALSSTLDLGTVLTTIVSRAVQLSGLDGGVVFEYDEAGEMFVQRAQADTGGALAAARRGARIAKGEGAIGRTALTLETVQVADITVPGAYVGPSRDNLIESGIRGLLAVPMVREGRLIGCLGVSRNRPGEFSGDTIELLRTFATQSALAIQNARLFHEIEDKGRQLEAASRHKSEFLANMSHELRTPLNAVIGFSEVLLQRMFGALNDKQDEYLRDIYASGQHLLSLINDILDLSKIEAGRMELTPAPFHLPGALENAVTLVKERAGRHGIALELDLDPSLVEVVADERKVKQVVLNLLSNAVKFTPEGGRIVLRAGRAAGAVEIAVSDTGVGIAPEDQAAIFEEFRQVGSDERRREGTGLGLALARKFVELHGGRIRVESAVGRGSTFTFTLPLT